MSGAEKELNNKIYKKEVFQSDEKENSETNTQHRTSSFDSPYESVSELSNDFNFHLFNELNTKTISEEKNIFFRKEKVKRSISPEMNYYLCNEEYMKEKMPEGSNYKIKSKNYIKKSQFKNEKKNKSDSNCSLIKIEDVDLNKVNEILEDIKYVENNININYKDNFINTDLNSVINENSNLNELSNIPLDTFDGINMSLCSYINNYNFNCKYIIY
jgi:hypothetical protein